MSNFFLSDNYNHSSRKKVSVMAVVRSSVDNITRMIANVFHTCLNPDNVEMLLRMDDDDPDFILLSKSEIFNKYNIKLYVGFRYGYMGMNKYFNELVFKTVGDIIFHWGDDMDILINGWDNMLFQHIGEVAVLQNMMHDNTDNGVEAFPKKKFSPIITRLLFDIIGHYSPCVLSDVYYEYIGEIVGIMKMSKIDVFSDLNGFNEHHARAWDDFMSKDNMEQIEKDAQKVIDYMDSKSMPRRKIPYFVVDSEPSPRLEIRGGPRYRKYLVEFINTEEGKVIFSKSFPRYNWASCAEGKVVRVTDESGVVIFEHSFDLHE